MAEDLLGSLVYRLGIVERHPIGVEAVCTEEGFSKNRLEIATFTRETE